MFRCGEGWDSLCQFLDKEVPEIEFPHENKAGSATNIANKYNTFDVFKRGNREALRSVIKIVATTVSIALIGTIVVKKCSMPSLVWK